MQNQQESTTKHGLKQKRKAGTIKMTKQSSIPIYEETKTIPLDQRYKQQYAKIRMSSQVSRSKTDLLFQQYEIIIKNLITKNQILHKERNTLIQENATLKLNQMPLHSQSVMFSINSHQYPGASKLKQIDSYRDKSIFDKAKSNNMIQLYTLNSFASRNKIFIDSSSSAISGLSRLPSNQSTPISTHKQQIIFIEGVQGAMSKQTIKSSNQPYTIRELNSFEREVDENQEEQRIETPTLLNHNQNQKSQKVGSWVEVVRCPSDAMYGPFRCFYLMIISNSQMRSKIYSILQEICNDHNTEDLMKGLFEDNTIWISIARDFLQGFQTGSLMRSLIKSMTNDGEISTIMSYLNNNQLIDMTMVAILRHRLQYLFEVDEFPSHHEQFNALANQFDLQTNIVNNNYEFYSQESKQQSRQEYLLLSGCQSQNKASLQMEQQRKPLFTILFNETQKFYQFQIQHCCSFECSNSQSLLQSYNVTGLSNGCHNYSFQEAQFDQNQNSRQLIESQRPQIYLHDRGVLRQKSSNQNVRKLNYPKFCSTEKLVNLRKLQQMSDQNCNDQNKDLSFNGQQYGLNESLRDYH